MEKVLKLFCAAGCLAAALLSVNHANADIIVTDSAGIVTNLGSGDVIGENGQLRAQDLLITAGGRQFSASDT